MGLRSAGFSLGLLSFLPFVLERRARPALEQRHRRTDRRRVGRRQQYPDARRVQRRRRSPGPHLRLVGPVDYGDARRARALAGPSSRPSDRPARPFRSSINTTGLPQGLSTGILTVKDPNAVDAPQTVTVTVRVGAVSVDVRAGRRARRRLRDLQLRRTRSPRRRDGGPWLSCRHGRVRQLPLQLTRTDSVSTRRRNGAGDLHRLGRDQRRQQLRR